MSPSVSRATFMFSVLAIGNIINHKNYTLNTVFFTAFILIIINPYNLFNISFLLSYSAVISIITLYPHIKNIFHLKNVLFIKIWELTALSLSAQIGTLPLCLYFFHKFSIYFIFSNYIVIPLASIIIYLAVTLFFTSSITYIGNGIAYLLNSVLQLQNYGIKSISTLPYSTYLTWIDLNQMILLYLTIFAITLFLIYNKKQFIFYIICCLSLILSERIYQTVNAHQNTEIIVYNDHKNLLIDFIAKNKHTIYSSNYNAIKNKEPEFWIKEQFKKPSLIKNTGLINFYGKRIFIASNSIYHHKKNKKKLNTDILIIDKNSKLNIWDIDNLFKTKQIVMDGSCSDYKNEQTKEYCKNKHIPFYSVKINGAYIKKYTY